MNKSKFLKRSLAALLAILMVATMIPSAFAAVVTAEDVPTAHADDPGYSIWVDNNEATWDAANDAYTAKAEFTEGSPVPSFKVSMKQDKPNTTVIVEKSGKKLSAVEIALDPADADSKNLTNSFGAGAYAYNMVAKTTNSDGEVIDTFNFKLVVNVTMNAPSNDTTIKAVKTARLPYAIKATVDNNNNTIDIVMALGKKNHHDSATGLKKKDDSAVSALDDFKAIFVPSSDNITAMTYNYGTVNDATGTLTVTSQNGDIKTSAVNYTSEDAFETFKIGDYAGTVKEGDPQTIYIDLPYDEFIDPAHTNGDKNDVDLAALTDVAATWTVPSDVVKVSKSDGTPIKSGEFVPVFAGSATVGNPANADEKGYYLVDVYTDSTNKVHVETKKRGGVEPITIQLRIPQKNPNADLTGIQVGDGNQYYPISGETTTINLPTGVLKADTPQAIMVWGSYNATVELAKAGSTGDQEFGTNPEPIDDPDPGNDPTEFTASSGNALDVSARLILKVTSEDEKTVKFYNIDVKDDRPTNPVLKSVEFIDANGNVVATGTIKSGTPGAGTVDITVPFATGIDLTELAALDVVATADPSTKIEIANMSYTGVAAVPAAIPAEYVSTDAITTSLPTLDQLGVTDGTTDMSGEKDYTFEVHGIDESIKFTVTATNDGSGNYTHAITEDLEAALGKWAAAYTTAQAAADTENAGHWSAEVVDSNKIKFTYSVGGSFEEGGTLFEKAGEIPAGTTLVADTGKDAAPATVKPADGITIDNAFVKAYSLDTAMGIDADLGGSTIPTTIPTVGKKDDPAAGNTFLMKVSNSANSNNATVYTVTVTKKAPNTAADITGVELIGSDRAEQVVRVFDTTYPASVSGRKITVATLPYALKKDAEDGTDAEMAFSKLNTSEGARVVWFDGTNVNILVVTEPPLTASDVFTVWTDAADNWTKAGKEVVLYVYSEEAWSKIAGGPSDTVDNKKSALDTYWGKVAAGTLNEETDDLYPATATYKMSASYADPERDAVLEKIASTLDDKLTAVKESNTVKITVPYSYMTNQTPFTLNMTVSKLATIHHGEGGAELKSDLGDVNTVNPTQFKVTGTQETPELYFTNDNGSNWTKFTAKMFIVSEAGVDKSKLNVEVKVLDPETSVDIESITVAGVRAVKDVNDPYIWNLTVPSGAEQLQNISIVPTSKMAVIDVDGDDYDPDNWYDLGADIEIAVASEKVPDSPIVYTLKINEGALSNDASISSITAGEYEAKKGSGTAWTVNVPEGTDMSKAPLTIVTADSGALITSVNGEAYTTGMTVDLSEGKTVTVVVTAANGETVTYTIESTFGSTPVDRPSDKYTDIPAAPMGDYVRSAIDNGIMIGTSATKFSPNMEVSRWQFALLIARADLRVKNAAITNADEADAELIKLYSGTPTFDDTKDLDKLYNAAIEYCNKNGIIDGKGDNKFAPKAVVTRLEAARMISDWTGITDDTKTENTNNIKDWNLVNWGKQYVNAVYDAGFIQGYPNGNFGPKDNLKRGQSAVIIMKAFEYMTDK